MLAQESLAAGQRRRVDALERSQAEMQRAMDERVCPSAPIGA